MHVLIFANAPDSEPPAELPKADLLIAADGGARMAFSLGRVPDLLIGDLDSLSADEVAGFDRAGTGIIRYPSDKDETDLELALDAALNEGASRVTLLGMLGGRWDMSLSNVLLLAHERYSALSLTLLEGATRMHIVRPDQPLLLSGEPGARVSAVPLGGPVQGVTYHGLRWPLENADLPFGSPRGISNRMATSEARVDVKAGVLLMIYDGGDVEALRH